MYKPITVEYTSDDLLWIDFKGKEIRIQQDEQVNNGQLQITVHKAKLSFGINKCGGKKNEHLL